MENYIKEYYLLLRELNYLYDSDFELSEQDKADGMTSVDEKLELDHSLNVEHNGTYAIYKDLRGKVVVMMKGREGIDDLVKDKLEEMEKDDLIKLIEWLPGKGETTGYRGVLEEWGWKLREHGDYLISEYTEGRRMSSLFNDLMKLANQLDEKGHTQEANMVDSILKEAGRKIDFSDYNIFKNVVIQSPSQEEAVAFIKNKGYTKGLPESDYPPYVGTTSETIEQTVDRFWKKYKSAQEMNSFLGVANV